MKKYYRIVDRKQESGIGEFVPDGFTVYEDEPQELVDALEAERTKQNINSQIQEANQYLSSTGWIWEKYNRNVLVLKDLTDEEFRLKYNDIIDLQEESRLNINILELELEELTKGGN